MSKTCFVSGEQLASDPYYELELLEQCLGLELKFKRGTFYKEDGNYCIDSVDGGVYISNSIEKALPAVPLLVKSKLIEYFRPMRESMFQIIGRKIRWRNFNT